MLLSLITCAFIQSELSPTNPTSAPQVSQEPSAPSTELVSAESQYGVLGNFFGVRDSMGEKGITFNGSLTLDFSQNTMGGLRTGFWGQAFLDLAFEVDSKKFAQIDGGTFHLEMQGYNRLTHQDYPIGDFVFYNGNYPGGENSEVIISSLYWRQKVFGDLLEVQFGKSDAASNFAFINGASEFMSNYGGYVSGIAQYIANWGDPATALEIALKPTEQISWQAAWYDGSTNSWNADSGDNGPKTGGRGPSTFFDNTESAMLMSELQFEWSLGKGYDGLVKGGSWVHLGQTGLNGPLDTTTGDLVSTVIDNAYGFYGTALQTVWAAEGSADSGPKINLFGALSWSDPSRNPVEWGFNGGMTFAGLVPGRQDDSFGLMGSWTLFTDSAGITALGTQYGLPSSPGGSEKNIEAFYKFQITPSFSIQPDVQWIGTPSGSLDDALVGSLRFQIDF